NCRSDGTARTITGFGRELKSQTLTSPWSSLFHLPLAVASSWPCGLNARLQIGPACWPARLISSLPVGSSHTLISPEWSRFHLPLHEANRRPSGLKATL